VAHTSGHQLPTAAQRRHHDRHSRQVNAIGAPDPVVLTSFPALSRPRWPIDGAHGPQPFLVYSPR